MSQPFELRPLGRGMHIPSLVLEPNGKIRPRRSMAGEGMVTPRKPMTVRDDGRVETLHPGSDRLIVDHELVRRNPAAFVACWSRDVTVKTTLVRMMERSRGKRPGRATLGRGRVGGALDVGNMHGFGSGLRVPSTHGHGSALQVR